MVFATLPSSGQECTLPSRIFLPQTDVARYDGYGLDVDVDNNYMVAGAPSNDSLQVDAGRAYVYKLGADNKWIKIAELFASDAAKSNGFGSAVSISGNSIAVRAREYRDDGSGIPKIYIFEKPSDGEWTSSSESYIISHSDGAQYNAFGEFHLHGNEMIAITSLDSQTRIYIYVKTGGVFLLSQSIDVPVTRFGRNDLDWKLAVSDDFLPSAASNSMTRTKQLVLCSSMKGRGDNIPTHPQRSNPRCKRRPAGMDLGSD